MCLIYCQEFGIDRPVSAVHSTLSPPLTSSLNIHVSHWSVIVLHGFHHSPPPHPTPLLCHRLPGPPSSPCSVIAFIASLVYPLFCHRPSSLLPPLSSVTVPLLCHRPSPLSHRPPSVIVPLLCNRFSPLSSSPLLYHRPSPLSPCPSSVIVFPFQQRMLSGTPACFISLWQSRSLPSSLSLQLNPSQRQESVVCIRRQWKEAIKP